MDLAMPTITERLSAVKEQIHKTAVQFGRSAEDVILLAVSKTKPAEAIAEAYEAGQRDFGENYLQEAIDKIDRLQPLDICWHFIGPIQSNKTRPIAEHFDWVHSIDRLKLARRINDQRPESLPPINVCLQVNISEEASKSGVSPAELDDLARDVAQLPNLHLRGLMSIPAATNDPSQQRASFAKLREAMESLNRQGHALDTLSMGMSGDLNSAIAEGSTMVRIGTAIFGSRHYPNHK